MTEAKIKEIQKRIGTEADGFWGPKSIAACRKHLVSLMPKEHPFPAEGSKAFDNLYGPHGEDGGFTPPAKKFKLPFTVFFEGQAVTSLRAHEKCADRLLAVFENLAKEFPTEASRHEAGITTYDGLYNPRLKRNSTTSWSMHAWMTAIDLNAGENGNRVAWPVASTMPLEVMECFAVEGWLAAGAFWGRDAMHFQATKPV